MREKLGGTIRSARRVFSIVAKAESDSLTWIHFDTGEVESVSLMIRQIARVQVCPFPWCDSRVSEQKFASELFSREEMWYAQVKGESDSLDPQSSAYPKACSRISTPIVSDLSELSGDPVLPVLGHYALVWAKERRREGENQPFPLALLSAPKADGLCKLSPPYWFSNGVA